jgi:hypothetical protein
VLGVADSTGENQGAHRNQPQPGGQFTVTRRTRSKRIGAFRIPPPCFPSLCACLAARVGCLLLLLAAS